MILQIYRETVTPGRERDYDALERDTATNAARLGCPNPYVAAESLRGPTVIWFFNAYDSAAEQRRGAHSYMHNAKLMAALARNSSHKAEFTGNTSDVFAEYRADASKGATWAPGLGRFLCIVEITSNADARGAVFDTADGARFVVTAWTTRDAAEQVEHPQGHLLAVKPSWSVPAPAWVAADREFWA
jgi:hypothetical protein